MHSGGGTLSSMAVAVVVFALWWRIVAVVHHGHGCVYVSALWWFVVVHGSGCRGLCIVVAHCHHMVVCHGHGPLSSTKDDDICHRRSVATSLSATWHLDCLSEQGVGRRGRILTCAQLRNAERTSCIFLGYSARQSVHRESARALLQRGANVAYPGASVMRM